MFGSSDREFFHYQIVLIFMQSAAELVRFLQTYKIWVSLKEAMGFSKKCIFFRIGKGVKFAVKYE